MTSSEMMTDASPSILLVTERAAHMRAFADALSKAGRMQIQTAASAEKAFGVVRQKKICLAVIDERVGAAAGLDLVRRLIELDAFIHTAVLSDAAEEEFHDRSEGLGVLAQLPLLPGPEDARRLIELLNNIMPG